MLTLSLFLVASCGPPEEPAFCRVDAPSSAPPTHDVQLGVRSGGEYVAWGDGDQVGVVRGGQGAVMIVPRVRIPNAPVDATELCMRIELDNEFEDGLGPFSSLVIDETFHVIDGGWESVSLEVPVAYDDVDMKRITFTATVRGETFTAEGTVTLELLQGT
jgi:hypothetical protein